MRLSVGIIYFLIWIIGFTREEPKPASGGCEPPGDFEVTGGFTPPARQ
jgi:hypothetical protein